MVKLLAEAFNHVWLDPNVTLLLMATAPLLIRTAMPSAPAAIKVSVFPLTDMAVVMVPLKVRLLMVKSCPRVVAPKFPPVGVVVVKMTLVRAVGSAVVGAPVAVVAKFVADPPPPE